MSGTGNTRQDNGVLLVLLAAIGLALVTILSVWKLKQFKYKLIHETGGAMFYGKHLFNMAYRVRKPLFNDTS